VVFFIVVVACKNEKCKDTSISAGMNEANYTNQTGNECRLFHHLPGVYYVLKYSGSKWDVTYVPPGRNFVRRYSRRDVWQGYYISAIHQSAEKLDTITQKLSTFVYEYEIEMHLKEYQENS
jgi:hypothetical protein